MNSPELRARIIAEWSKGKFPSEIAKEIGLTESRVNGIIKYGADAEANHEHFRNRGLEVRRYISPQNLDREARVLAIWAEGWSATDIAIGFGDGMTRNTAIGIVNRGRGEVAERAKREHAAASALRYPKGPPRVKPETARRDGITAVDTILAKPEPPRIQYTRQFTADFKRQRRDQRKPRSCLVKPVISAREIAERREKLAAVGRAAIARVELTLANNPAFVKVEKPWDPYSHLRSDKNYHDAIAALTRRA